MRAQPSGGTVWQQLTPQDRPCLTGPGSVPLRCGSCPSRGREGQLWPCLLQIPQGCREGFHRGSGRALRGPGLLQPPLLGCCPGPAKREERDQEPAQSSPGPSAALAMSIGIWLPRPCPSPLQCPLP